VAVVTQNEAPGVSYSPFEGLADARRVYTSVPRGILRFDLEVGLDAKPVNDSHDLQITCSFPAGFAYIMSSVAFEIEVDTATDWDANCQSRIFNGLPNSAPGNVQFGTFGMANVPGTVAQDPRRILNFQLGTLSDWYRHPIFRSSGAVGHSFILNYHNSAAAVQGAGSVFFHAACYQYELNQAVRFPLNNPLPVASR